MKDLLPNLNFQNFQKIHQKSGLEIDAKLQEDRMEFIEIKNIKNSFKRNGIFRKDSGMTKSSW